MRAATPRGCRGRFRRGGTCKHSLYPPSLDRRTSCGQCSHQLLMSDLSLLKTNHISHLDAIRALLTAKPRPVGWHDRRERIDEIGSTWPVAADIKLEEAKCDGVPIEWSIAPGSDASRVLLFFHGGGYCSG